MAFAITYKTTEKDILSATKNELVTAMRAHNVDIRNQKKEAMVLDALNQMRAMKVLQEEKEAKAKAERDAQLEKDLAHPRFVTALKKLTKSAEDIAAYAKKTKDEAVAKLTEDVRGQLCWQFEKLAYFAELEDSATRIAGFFRNLATGSRTITEVQGELAAIRDNYLDRVLTRSFSTSTNGASNLIDVQEFEVVRRIAKIMAKCVEAFATDIANENVDAHYRCESIGWSY